MGNKRTMWRTNKEGEPIRRHNLSELLPMETPISIDIEASSVCNLKCRYCPQSLDVNKKNSMNIGKNGLMEMDLFEKIVEQLKEFPYPLKNIRFAGYGEPLLNKRIIEMIDLVRKEQVAETITVFTNGIPLTKEIATKLAGKVDTILFDIQGICAEDYEKWCDTKVDYDELVKNIKFLYDINEGKKIFCKTFKSIVDGKENVFEDIFNDVCDEIGIEDLYETCPEIDYSDMVIKEKGSEKYGMEKTQYCPWPWYQMAIDASGRVTACPIPISKHSDFLLLGNVRENKLVDIWNGNKLARIRYNLLTERQNIAECKDCKYTDLIAKEDRIDGIVDILIDYCKCRMKKEGI